MADPQSYHDALSKILPDLKSRTDEVRQKTAKSLRNYVAQQAREMSNENFSKFMNELNGHIFELVNSSNIQDKIGGITAIDELIDIDYDENATKVTRLANYLRIGLSTSDITVMHMASKALGRLARSSGALTAECVEFEVKRALEWLQERERYEPRRHAAVLVLKELALNSPTLFYVHVSSFVELIWVALRDPKTVIREGAGEALRACLDLIAERENRMKLQWYQKIYDEAQKGLKNTSPEFTHGSLIALGELLKNTGDFVTGRYKDICDAMLKYRDSRDKHVKKTVICLLPRLGMYSPELFVHNNLNTCMNHILSALRNQNDRAVAFISLGEIAVAVGGNIKPYLESTVAMIKSGLTGKGKQFCPEALTCISMLASAVGAALIPHVHALLPLMFNAGLSQTLTDSLRDLTIHTPALIPIIQQKLLDLLSQVLNNKPFGKRVSVMYPAGPAQPQIGQQERDGAMIALALKTLGTFDFSQYSLLDFVRECVVNYLDDDNSDIRREAAVTCTKLIVRAGEAAPTRGHSAVVVGEVLEKLLVVGIADPDPSIRRTVLASLDIRFDHQLAQAENLRSLFIALNDEVFEIRELSIIVIGRLTTRNPAYVMPSLRKTLIQFLTELEFSGDSRNKEESARLLGHLIGASERLIKPYVEPILKALLPKLRDSSPRVASCVLAALGELAIVGGEDMVPHMNELLPLIIDTLQDQSSTSKREVALHTLGLLAKSTGYVVTPFLRNPALLDIFLNLIKVERAPQIRREVTKVFGIIGAVDPYKHKMNQLTRPEDQKTSEDKGPSDQVPTISTTSEDYYPTVAITALMRILRDHTLSMHHTMVIQAVMFIFKSLGLKCIPFLPQIMPPFLHVMNTCESGFREFLFQQMGSLVSIVKQHIRDYLDDVFVLINKYWNSSLLIPIINLVEEISLALNDEFKVFLPNLIPQMLNVLHSDRTAKRQATQKVLRALEVFANNLNDYLHLVIPAVVRLFDQVDAPASVRIVAIQTIGRLCKKLNFSDYASRIIHPLARVLDSDSTELREDAMQTLYQLVYQLGSDYAIFIPMVGKILTKREIQSPAYETLVTRLLKNQQLLLESGNDADGPNQKHPDLAEEPNQVSPETGVKKLKVNEQSLKKAWEASQRSTKEDWIEWIRRFSVELLRESPSPALRSCLSLAQDYPPLVRELFNAGFVSCWSELHEQQQDELVRSLETAFLSPNIPPEILQILLNLAEFMEHDNKPLPIDIRTLGALAEKCHAYAKALHYKETEFHSSPSTTIEALISINNQLQQPEAAIGILLYAQQNHSIELKESWYEKLRRWEDALSVYERKQKDDPTSTEYMLGRMRCLHALGEWDRLAQLSKEIWKGSQDNSRTVTAPLAAAAAFNLGEWSTMEEYVGAMSEDTVEGSFFRATLEIHRDNYQAAQRFIDRTRDLLDPELTALVGESYTRAYKLVVRVQQLSELEEIIEYKQLKDNPERQNMIRTLWKRRLLGCQHNVDVWQSLLAVHKLVIPPLEELDLWLKFIGLCRKGGRLGHAQKTLTMLMGKDPAQQSIGMLPNAHPRVTFAYIKQLWSAGAKHPAFEKLRVFVQALKHSDDVALLGRAYLKLGEWQFAMKESLDDTSIPQICASFKAATECDTNWYKAWHAWALINFEVVSHYSKKNASQDTILQHLVTSIQGFFRSIALAPDQSLQDILRLLTLWFQHGALKDVEAALREGFNTVSIDTWLQVIPQIIARIHSPVMPVRRLTQELLASVGKEHPQALVYSLTVASKSQSASRLAAARSIMDKMRKHSATLVDQALMASQELIRVAILWNEMWHEALEEASRLYFGDHNVEGMLATLQPLHAMLDKGPETLREVAFEQAFGRDLQEAMDWCKKYMRSRIESDLHQAWDLYTLVYRKIKKQLPQITTLELQYVSPKLLSARDFELAVPGTYRAGEPIVRISSFAPTLSVFNTKQRPRKLTIHGSDGIEYVFLLKGHEDLRQDERVMQLFGLVNNLLANDHETAKSHLSITRYAVIPLSPNSGLIGWVPHSDTLHTLIKDYRESRKILLDIECRLMAQMSSDYSTLPLLQKVEVFGYALENTNGHDLDKVLWRKSRNSEVWLERRTNYTRSLAVMSMVGYILGLGDRHPSNLMLDRISGRIIHIDFGDCFEVALHRDQYPEKIPFRLTRMLTNAMEVSGIEGNFRITCEAVMNVLRHNKDSLMAVLEAFVHDPLINWRLLTPNSPVADSNTKQSRGKMDNDIFDSDSPEDIKSSLRNRQRNQTRSDEKEADIGMPEVLNERALTVINRVSKKLTGRDFSNEILDVPAQVQRLIEQATSHENLCQCWVGWCPFW